jgi:hypothetical protein
MNDLLTGNTDEEYRHQCEVRQLIKWRKEWGLQRFQRYLQTNGFSPRIAKLREDIADQWAKGNRGQKGDWR